jgi:hypothetical protein
VLCSNCGSRDTAELHLWQYRHFTELHLWQYIVLSYTFGSTATVLSSNCGSKDSDALVRQYRHCAELRLWQYSHRSELPLQQYSKLRCAPIVAVQTLCGTPLVPVQPLSRVPLVAGQPLFLLVTDAAAVNFWCWASDILKRRAGSGFAADGKYSACFRHLMAARQLHLLLHRSQTNK